MQVAYSTLITDSRAFLNELSENNNREWFNENKTRYDTALKKPAKALLGDLQAQLATLLEQPVSTKLFRANRDVRFSKDKTPYSTHLHMMWTPQGNGTQPAYFFGIAQEYVKVGAGVMSFDKAQQSAWRAWVSEREGDAFQTRIDATGATLGKPELKRVPSPFEKDHPRAELLQRKSLVLWKDIETEPSADVAGAINDAFTLFNPVMDDLRAFL